MIGKVQKFVSEVVVELKKVSWSTRKELIDATWIVLLSSIMLGIFIGGTDFVLSKLLGIVIG
jgi:preprotein translocase subunit SecE